MKEAASERENSLPERRLSELVYHSVTDVWSRPVLVVMGGKKKEVDM